MHLTGNESHGERENLAYGCKSCNGKLGAAFKAIGAGRPTNQYNPSKGVPTFEQYAWAVTQGNRKHYVRGSGWVPGAHDEAGAIIHATPKHKRIEYAKAIARKASGTKRQQFEDRWNPSRTETLWIIKDGIRPIEIFHSVAAAEKKLGYYESLVSRGRMSGKDLRIVEETREYPGGRVLRSNPWPFSSAGRGARQTTPASGGIAHHSRGRKRADDPNAEFLKSRKSKKSAPAGVSRVPDERTIQEGFKRGLSLAEILRGNPALRKLKASNPAAFDRCVKAVQAKGGAANAYAVCTAAGKRNPGKFYVVDPERTYKTYPAATLDAARVKALKLAKKHYTSVSIREHIPGDPFGRQVEIIGGNSAGRRNPAGASAEVFEEFHGYAPSEVITVTKKVFHHADLAAAGKLTHLEIWGIDEQGHNISGFKGALLAFNKSKNQLFVEGGDQSINLEDFGIRKPHELETLGQLTDIGYHTNKTHLGDEGGEAVYVHKLRTTNNNGRHVVVKIARFPDVIYDVRNEQLLFSGGSYEILREGINK